jgi:hypothetical protein
MKKEKSDSIKDMAKKWPNLRLKTVIYIKKKVAHGLFKKKNVEVQSGTIKTKKILHHKK